ncbi:MFS transporter [Pseudomonas sp. MWU16-30317]|uniref:MFS transporter n=1 Tax=Pseudomonas sp. MWU16-30317 TaxID=2878095 RepID=UPI001CFA9B06|nr:MFS transporter [Pseudomonas sp. MWU16-30317]
MTTQALPLQQVTGKIARRLLPFLLLMYIVAFLDRANVSFAKVAFQADNGISDAAFAFGAGVFFVGYALLEVPSNLMLHRYGAKVWMCRIMVTWGLASAAMMLASSETSFYILRFLLGVAEAGFFPGVILYLTYWFPDRARAKAMGIFYFGAPLAFILGSPLSGLLLELEGYAGWHGWQWMFAVEGLLAVLVGICAYLYLDDKPVNARWLNAQELQTLSNALAQEQSSLQGHASTLPEALMRPSTLYLCLTYCLIQASVYGVVFYLPSQVATLMASQVGFKVGVVAALPWCAALLATYLICAWADRHGQRRLPAALCLLLGGLGIAACAMVSTPLWGLLALCAAASGFIAVQPLFWTYPARILSGSAAAGGIALINSVGALGGFLAPNLRQWAETHYHSAAAGLYALAALTLLGAVMILGLDRLHTAAVRRPARNAVA